LIFDQDNIAFTILDVLELHQENRRLSQQGRPFGALSFRYDSDTLIDVGGTAHDVSNTVCYFPPDMPYTRITKRDHLIVIHFESHTYFSNQLEMFVPQHPQTYHQLFQQALDCWNARQSGYQLRTAALLYQILALAHDENKAVKTARTLVEQALQLLDSNYLRKDFFIFDVAHELHISEVYLRRLFKREMGISPKQYLLQKRIRKAVSLLETDYFSIADIAAQSGFNDPKYFSVAFKKVIGISPSEYADRIQNKPSIPANTSEGDGIDAIRASNQHSSGYMENLFTGDDSVLP